MASHCRKRGQRRAGGFVLTGIGQLSAAETLHFSGGSSRRPKGFVRNPLGSRNEALHLCASDATGCGSAELRDGSVFQVHVNRRSRDHRKRCFNLMGHMGPQLEENSVSNRRFMKLESDVTFLDCKLMNRDPEPDPAAPVTSGPPQPTLPPWAHQGTDVPIAVAEELLKSVSWTLL